MEGDHQYYDRVVDLSCNYINMINCGVGGRPNFHLHQPIIPLPPPPVLPPDHTLLLSSSHQTHNYSDSAMLQPDPTVVVTTTAGGGGSGQGYYNINNNNNNNNSDFRPDHSSGYNYGGFEFMEVGGGCGGTAAAGSRWPRQETLTLLEIRSRLDSKFKESTQKGPLWDEVSRIMSEEHGYQRTGKKCREKFDNLYKYYKKTRDGKSGRHDGKNYRFFRQLEALYGDSKNAASFSGSPLAANQESLDPFKTSSEFYSEINGGLNTLDIDGPPCDHGDHKGKNINKKKKKWKEKVEEFIDSEMRNIMEKQEDWLVKTTKMIEDKEQERLRKENEWKKLEEFRIEREQSFWANQKSWIEGRNVALMEAIRNITGGSKDHMQLLHVPTSQETKSGNSWPECEITCLIQLRTSMEPRFHQQIEESCVLWEEIATKMAYLGYDRNGLMCKDKWDSINKINNGAPFYHMTLQNDHTSHKGGGIYSSSAIGGNNMAMEGQSSHQYVLPPPPPDHHIRGGDGCFRSIHGWCS